MSKHTPGPWLPPFRTVSQCPTSQYAQGWNDCREAMIKSDQAPRLLEALEDALAQMEADLIAMDAEFGPCRDDVDEIIADDPKSAAVCAIVSARAAIKAAKGESND